MTDPIERRPSTTCYHAKFGHFRSNNTGVITEICGKNLTLRVPRSGTLQVIETGMDRDREATYNFLLVIHSYSTQWDSCNSVLVGVSKQLLQRMLVIQNAAARFITGARRFEHMTPVLRNLHWLPIRHRIKFKTAV